MLKDLKMAQPDKGPEPVLDSFDLEGVARFIQSRGVNCKIIVMCGAGISVSAGIPVSASANLRVIPLHRPML